VNYDVSERGGGRAVVGLVEISEGLYEIAIDGETVRVDAVKSGRTIYSIIEEGRQFEAMVDEQGAHGFDVAVAGRLFHLQAVDERTQLLAGSAHSVATGKQSVEAEMPGKVVKISVPLGSPVAEGEGVVILEAMKMENEIPSPIDGVVTEIAVSEGETVETGTLLFVVEPPDPEGE
jgi:biotin carboxyl carrier protein